jgi:RimJ/RimL family protein N-acetyltransferase
VPVSFREDLLVTLRLNSGDGRVFLRPFGLDDLHRNHRWHNDPSLYAHLVGQHRTVSLETEKRWLLERMEVSATELSLAICLPSSEEHIGNIYLREINRSESQAEIHLFLGERDQRGMGYGGASIRCMIDHAFGVLGLQRIVLHVLANNTAAIKSYIACGFQLRGTLDEPVLKGGQPVAVQMMRLEKAPSGEQQDC